MSKHTPGPWAILSESRGAIVTARDGCYDVAIVRDIGNEDNKANARLIAAAPELLQALADLLEAADSMCGTFGCIRGDTPEDADTFIHDEWAEAFLKERADSARAAIAKATGGDA